MALKILLADDSMTAQNMGKKILTDAGFDVVAVSNGAAAMKKVAADKPDVIILDVYMPGYTGLEVCERIKNSVETSSTPVLLTVGKMEPFRPEEANRVRADGVMIKPFEATDLTAAVRTILEKLHGGPLPTPVSAPVAASPKSNGNGQKVKLPAVLQDYEDTIRLTPEELKEIEIQDAHYEEWKSNAVAESADGPAQTATGVNVLPSAPQASQPISKMSAETAAVAESATPMHQDDLSAIPAASPDEEYGIIVNAPAGTSETPAAVLEMPLADVPAFAVEFTEAKVLEPAASNSQVTEPVATGPVAQEQEFELESSQSGSAEAVGLPPLPELEFTAAPVETGEIQIATAPELELPGSPEQAEVNIAADPALVTNTDQDVGQFAVKVGQEHPDDISTEFAGEWTSTESSESSPSAETWSEQEPQTAAADTPPASLPELSPEFSQHTPAADPGLPSLGESAPEAPTSVGFGSIAFGDVLKPQADREEETQTYEAVPDIPLPHIAEPAAVEETAPEQAAIKIESTESASTSAAGMMWEVSGSPGISFEQAAEKLEAAESAETFGAIDSGEITAQPAGADARIHERIEVNESASLSPSEMNLPPASEWFTPARQVAQSPAAQSLSIESSDVQNNPADLDVLQEEAPALAPPKELLANGLPEAAPEISAAETAVREESAPATMVEAPPAFAPLAEATAAAASRMDQPPNDDQIERAVTRALERLKAQLISEISRELGSK